MRRTIQRFLFLFAAAWGLTGQIDTALANMIVTVQGPETAADTRYEYDHAVIRLALEKTRNKYGDYTLQETPTGQNSKRSLLTVSSNRYTNYIIKHSMSNKLPDGLIAIPFPVDLGIVGYRVGFVSQDTKEKLKAVKTLEDLQRFEIIQGIGWLDAFILEHHGFKVRKGEDFNAMFSMVALNRSDLFLRGANELLAEWRTHQSIPKLTHDDTISIYYPLPRFLITSEENTELAARVHEGLLTAFEDGSLIKLWEEKYLASVEFADLKSRKVFRLTNPFLGDLDPSWVNYVYQVAPEAIQ
jgi:ABC-type amino acid transport substrate-binding protein